MRADYASHFSSQRKCWLWFSILLDAASVAVYLRFMAKTKEQERVHVNVAIRADIAQRLKGRAAKMGWSLKIAVERLLGQAMDQHDADERAIKEMAKGA